MTHGKSFATLMKSDKKDLNARNTSLLRSQFNHQRFISLSKSMLTNAPQNLCNLDCYCGQILNFTPPSPDSVIFRIPAGACLVGCVLPLQVRDGPVALAEQLRHGALDGLDEEPLLRTRGRGVHLHLRLTFLGTRKEAAMIRNFAVELQRNLARANNAAPALAPPHWTSGGGCRSAAIASCSQRSRTRGRLKSNPDVSLTIRIQSDI